MQMPEKERQELALLWEVLWPILGALFGAILGLLIGGALSGMLAALSMGLVGALIGLKIGHFFGEFVKLIFLPWFEFLTDGKSWPVIGGLAGAGALVVVALQLEAGTGLAAFLGCFGFICGAWSVVLVRAVVDWGVRTGPPREDAKETGDVEAKATPSEVRR